MPNILCRKNAAPDDRDFVVAAARAFYCDWYLSDEARAAAITSPGVELTEMIRETEAWAFDLARSFLADFEAANKPIDALLEEFSKLWKGDREFGESTVGWYAGMEALGHGVGLFDYGIDIENMPRVEAYPETTGRPQI
jgi:hypothetical protein